MMTTSSSSPSTATVPTVVVSADAERVPGSVGMAVVGDADVVVVFVAGVVEVGVAVDERGDAAGSSVTMVVRDRDVRLDWLVVELLGLVGVDVAVGPTTPSAPALDSDGSASTAVASNSGKGAISGAGAAEF